MNAQHAHDSLSFSLSTMCMLYLIFLLWLNKNFAKQHLHYI